MSGPIHTVNGQPLREGETISISIDAGKTPRIRLDGAGRQLQIDDYIELDGEPFWKIGENAEVDA